MPTTSLDEALTALHDGQFERALELLLIAWRERRLPRLARHVEWTSARLPAVPLEERAWREVAREHHAPALPALLATLTASTFDTARERVDALRGWEDPRIVSGFLGILGKPRYRAPGAQWFYERFFDVLHAQRDPRTAPTLEALVARYHEVVTNSYGPVLVKFMREAIGRATRDDLREGDWAPLLDALDDFFSAERGDGARAEHERVSRAAREKQLRAEVLAHPGDDARLQVWADTLVEQNDPRGELLNLQLMERHGALTAAQLEQLRGVQSRHRDRLLGAIAPKVLNAIFERGQAVHVELGRAWGTPEATEAEWAFVKGATLPENAWGTAEWATLLLQLPKLETVMCCDVELLTELERRQPALRLRHALVSRKRWGDDVQPTNVAHLAVRGVEFLALLRAHPGRVTLEHDGEPSLAVQALADKTQVRFIDGAHLLDPLGFHGWCFDFDANTRRLEVRGRFAKSPDVARLEQWLAALKRLNPTQVVLHRAPGRDVSYLPLVPIEVELERVETAIGRVVTQS
jgi:uncharacterized protein (TIGR02996 family)